MNYVAAQTGASLAQDLLRRLGRLESAELAEIPGLIYHGSSGPVVTKPRPFLRHDGYIASRIR